MDSAREKWIYEHGEKVWVGKYLNSKNMLHWHDECELIFIERGAMEVFASGKNYRICKGNAMFFDSRMLHKMVSVDESTLLMVLVFARSIINDFAMDITLSSPFIEQGDGVKNAYQVILNELKNKAAMYNVITLSTISELMVKLFRNNPTAAKKPTDGVDDKFADLLCELEANAENYTLDDAAKFMNMNASYLSRLFAQKTGVNLIYYINRIRIQKAIKLMKTGDYSITEISTLCGFGTIRNFNDIFKKYTGYAPTALPTDFVFSSAIKHKTYSENDRKIALVESSS
ncbi:MAG: AraC family transcriptional regulator [Clostridiales bacterium]|nr:AraC family transcriptional regulator [Clostridiales bacterium]